MTDTPPDTSAPGATTELPLQAQLMGSLALVIVLSVVAGLVGYFSYDSRTLEKSVEAKAGVYSATMAAQLHGAVSLEDPELADAVIRPLSNDRNVFGVAVYSTSGVPLSGYGEFPPTLVRSEQAVLDEDRVHISVRQIAVGEGRAGHLLLALSTEHIVTGRFRASLFLAMTTAVLLLFSILLALAHSFSVMMSECVRLFEERRQMERTEKDRLEKLVAERTAELERGREQYRLVVEGTQAIPFALDVEEGRFEYIGPQGPGRLGFEEAAWKLPGFLDRLMPRDRDGDVRKLIDECSPGHFEFETTVLTRDETRVDLRWVVNCESESPGARRVMRGMMLDVTEQRRLESDLAQAQKLESVGRLAAGVAHEINTPVQFVSDSVQFVRDSMDDLSRIVASYRELRAATQAGEGIAAAARAAEEAEEDADLDYILENAPAALDRAREGLGRVTVIVRSMKEFAHPDRKEMAQVDINHAIASTLVIASNEYKYVADVVTEFGDLPPVDCYAGEINQVVLNLIVNAAHAIADVVKGTPEKGVIRVMTRVLDAEVEIMIADTGKGIPPDVRSRIFDPFFTTKEVGRGTGQGLAIARSVIVDKHQGTIHFETEMDKGTTFFIRLPIRQATASSAAA